MEIIYSNKQNIIDQCVSRTANNNNNNNKVCNKEYIVINTNWNICYKSK